MFCMQYSANPQKSFLENNNHCSQSFSRLIPNFNSERHLYEAPPPQILLLGRARAGCVLRADAATGQRLGDYLFFLQRIYVLPHLVSRNLSEIPACNLSRYPIVHPCAMPTLHGGSKSVPPVLSSIFVLAGNSMPPCLDWSVPCNGLKYSRFRRLKKTKKNIH